MFKKPEDAFYRIRVAIPKSPLLLERTFYVKSFSDVERVQNAAEKLGYKFMGWSVDHRISSDDVLTEIKEEMSNEF